MRPIYIWFVDSNTWSAQSRTSFDFNSHPIIIFPPQDRGSHMLILLDDRNFVFITVRDGVAVGDSFKNRLKIHHRMDQQCRQRHSVRTPYIYIYFVFYSSSSCRHIFMHFFVVSFSTFDLLDILMSHSLFIYIFIYIPGAFCPALINIDSHRQVKDTATNIDKMPVQ